MCDRSAVRVIGFSSAGSVRTVRGHTHAHAHTLSHSHTRTPTQSGGGRSAWRSRCWAAAAEVALCVRDSSPPPPLSPSPPAGDKLPESSCRWIRGEAAVWQLRDPASFLSSSLATALSPGLLRCCRRCTAPSVPSTEHRGAAAPHAGHSAPQDGSTCCRGPPVAVDLRNAVSGRFGALHRAAPPPPPPATLTQPAAPTAQRAAPWLPRVAPLTGLLAPVAGDVLGVWAESCLLPGGGL